MKNPTAEKEYEQVALEAERIAKPKITTEGQVGVPGKMKFLKTKPTTEGPKAGYEGGWEFQIGDKVYIDNSPVSGRIVGIITAKKTGRPAAYEIQVTGPGQQWRKPIRRKADQISKTEYDRKLYPGKWNLNPASEPARFTQTEITELINLYHTARIAGNEGRWARMVWAANQFHKSHPDIRSVSAYKMLDHALAHPEIGNPLERNVRDFMFENKTKYTQHAHEFERIFGQRLWNYWSMLTGFDIVKFDKEFIKPPEGVSTAQMIESKFGEAAVHLIRKLI